MRMAEIVRASSLVVGLLVTVEPQHGKFWMPYKLNYHQVGTRKSPQSSRKTGSLCPIKLSKVRQTITLIYIRSRMARGRSSIKLLRHLSNHERNLDLLTRGSIWSFYVGHVHIYLLFLHDSTCFQTLTLCGCTCTTTARNLCREASYWRLNLGLQCMLLVHQHHPGLLFSCLLRVNYYISKLFPLFSSHNKDIFCHIVFSCKSIRKTMFWN